MHSCVACDGACYCHGDIDDCEVETPQYAWMNCTGCGCKEDGLEGFADVDDLMPPSLEPADTTWQKEQEARRRQAELESAGQMRLLP